MMNTPIGDNLIPLSRNGLLNTGAEGSAEPTLPPDKSRPEFVTVFEERRDANLAVKEAREAESISKPVEEVSTEEGTTEESSLAFRTAPMTKAPADLNEVPPESDPKRTEHATSSEYLEDPFIQSKKNAPHSEASSRALFVEGSSRPERSVTPLETPPPARLEAVLPDTVASFDYGKGQAPRSAESLDAVKPTLENPPAKTQEGLALTASSSREAGRLSKGLGLVLRPTWTPSTDASSNNIQIQDQMSPNASGSMGAYGRRDGTLSLQPMQSVTAEQFPTLPFEGREPSASLSVPWRAGSLENQGQIRTGQDWRPAQPPVFEALSPLGARPAESVVQTLTGTPPTERPVAQNQPPAVLSQSINTPAQSPDRGLPVSVDATITSEPSQSLRHAHPLSDQPGRHMSEGRDHTPPLPKSDFNTATSTVVPNPKTLATAQPEHGREDAIRAFEPETGRSSTGASPIGHVESTTLLRPATMSAAELPRHVAQQLTHAFQMGGRNQADIVLSPVELGRVRINLHTSETGVMISIMTERPETLDLLRRHADVLAQEFREIGYDETEFSFSHNGGSQSQFNDDAPHNGSGENRPGLGDAMASDAPANTPSPVISLDRVDIRF